MYIEIDKGSLKGRTIGQTTTLIDKKKLRAIAQASHAFN